MKTIASIVFLIAGVVASGIAGMKLANAVVTAANPHPFANLSGAPLWTSTPVRVASEAAKMERLPALYSTYALAATRPQPRQTNDSTDVSPGAGPPEKEKRLSSVVNHLNWCASKYRSFDAATNSYRSFDGDRKLWEQPDTAIEQQQATISSTASDAADWCANRYKSYRASDNTYQPLYGGARRTCIAPRDVADASTTQ